MADPLPLIKELTIVFYFKGRLSTLMHSFITIKIRDKIQKNFLAAKINVFDQGTLTEGEGSVPLTSLYF
jgi:hypothetical protein